MNKRSRSAITDRRNLSSCWCRGRSRTGMSRT